MRTRDTRDKGSTAVHEAERVCEDGRHRVSAILEAQVMAILTQLEPTAGTLLSPLFLIGVGGSCEVLGEDQRHREDVIAQDALQGVHPDEFAADLCLPVTCYTVSDLLRRLVGNVELTKVDDDG